MITFAMTGMSLELYCMRMIHPRSRSEWREQGPAHTGHVNRICAALMTKRVMRHDHHTLHWLIKKLTILETSLPSSKIHHGMDCLR